MSVYGIISDLHFHDWSAFSSTDAEGINTRLAALIKEVRRVGDAVLKAGGYHLFVAGDVFHVRGKVSPLVLNPVKDLFRELRGKGLRVHILSGNHDLEGKHSTRLSSAITALEEVVETVVSHDVEYVKVKDDGPGQEEVVALVPWIEDLEELKNVLMSVDSMRASDLIIHAPVNGVIKGLPETGLDPKWLQEELEFRNVFSGHYHNHKQCADDVFSIGSIAHHSWSDVGSRAGYLLVTIDSGAVNFQASHCPSFVELTSEMDEATMALEADGAFVKVRLATADQKTIQGVRQTLLEAGAKGVVVIAEPASKAVERDAASIKKGMTLTESVAAYIDAGPFDNKEALTNEVIDLLTAAGSAE